MLAPFVEGYRAELVERGYPPSTVREKLIVLGRLGRWMAARDLTAADLDAERVEEFYAFRTVDRPRPVYERRYALQVLEFLVHQGVAAQPVQVELDPLEALLVVYRSWLVQERGLASATVIRYSRTARMFLRGREAGARVEGLDGSEVYAFLLEEARRCSVGAAKGRVAEMRSLLRFLFATGRAQRQLAASVPPVAGWRDTGLPKSLPSESIRKLVDSCDQQTPMGRRDVVMLLLLARLGLRSIEVARLRLEDVHWRTGEIEVRGKARRIDRMPLPAEVGQAIVGYLRDGRPTSKCREVFLTCRAPIRPIRADLVGDVVQRGCIRAGIQHMGAHRLRHALATSMVASGVPIIQISQVLRHQDLATTALYAKVEFDALRQVAKPWPGVLQ
ncbi:tyrosine-type recombinase/integrase [Humibacter antri]